MKLFINDKSIIIISQEHVINREKYNSRLTGRDEIISKKLVGKVLVDDAGTRHVHQLLKILEVKKLKKLESVTLAVREKDIIEEFIKDQFKIVKASGGLVHRNDQVLLIFRLGKWDLPKGKLKKKEDAEKGAKREVEEECNVKVIVKEKICSTWHTYVSKGKRVLKKTNWYLMDCLSDFGMQPQLEENIEEVKWVDKKDLAKLLKNSYRSIEFVFDEFYKTPQL